MADIENTATEPTNDDVTIGVLPPMRPATISKVLSFLDTKDLIQLVFVSKQLKEIVYQDSKVWMLLAERDFAYAPPQDVLVTLAAPRAWMEEYKAIVKSKKQMAESTLSFNIKTEDGTISEDGLSMECSKDFPLDPNTLMHGSVLAQSKYSQIPQLPGYVYYYEITIENETKGKIALGLAPKKMYRGVPGWAPSSIGIKLDDGKLYTGGHLGSRTKGERYTAEVKKGDVIGCGINLSTREQFFTLNGELKVPVTKRNSNQLDSILFLYHAAILSPTVALFGKGEKISINFGAKPFVTDLTTLKKGDSQIRTMFKICQLVRGDFLMQAEELEFGFLKQHFYADEWTTRSPTLICSKDKELSWRIIELFWIADPGKSKTTEEMEPELKAYAKKLKIPVSSDLEKLRETVKIGALKAIGKAIMGGFVEYVEQKIYNREEYEMKELGYEPGLALLSYLSDDIPSDNPLLVHCLAKYEREQKNYTVFLGDDFDTSRPDFKELFAASMSVLQYISMLEYWKDRHIREKSAGHARTAPVQLVQAGPEGFIERLTAEEIKNEKLALSSGALDKEEITDRILMLYLRIYFDVPPEIDVTAPIEDLQNIFVEFLDQYESVVVRLAKTQRMRDMATVMKSHAIQLQDAAIPDNSPIITDIKNNWKPFFAQMAPGLDYDAVSRRDLAANLAEVVRQIQVEMSQMLQMEEGQQQQQQMQAKGYSQEAGEVDGTEETVSTIIFMGVGLLTIGACAWAVKTLLSSSSKK